jgi:hypothetical protein
VKAWWLTKGWPWFKANWWVVLIVPLIAVVWLARKTYVPKGFTGDATLDDVLRARQETEAQLRKEKADLELKLEIAESKHRTLQINFESRLQEEVESLRNDPERLRQLMLRVGPGSK